MIFLTVGTELPFDRLVRAVDEWAQRTGRSDVFAQIGASSYRPTAIAYSQFLDASDFRRHFESADAIVSHAGMGTILTALSLGKPIVVLPREAGRGEHRNDHQLATARHMQERPGVEIAFDEASLERKLETLDWLRPTGRIGTHASDELIETLRDFVHESIGQPARRSLLARVLLGMSDAGFGRSRLPTAR